MDNDILKWDGQWLILIHTLAMLTILIMYILSLVMLWSMPPGDGMEKGREYDDMIGCAAMSLSQHLI